MTTPQKLLPAEAAADPNGPRATAGRVLANALLVLAAFEVVSIVVGVGDMVVAGATTPVTPVELVLLMAVFLLIRWIFVLPAMLPVLVALEYACRRVPQPRVLIAVVAFAPMILWELTNGPGGLSVQGAILGVTAVLFALIARLPAGLQRGGAEPRLAAQPPAIHPTSRRSVP
jgi:hypothetical protein